MPIVSRFLKFFRPQLVAKTQLSANVSAGADVVPVVDSGVMLIGDDVVIPLTTGERFWTTVLSIDDNNVTLANTLPSTKNPIAKAGTGVLMWGRNRVRIVLVPAIGEQITRQYLTEKTQAEVETDMAALNITDTLQNRDFDEVLQWVIDGNDPNTFDYTDRDVIKNKAEERVTKIFARSRGDDAVALSWWIDSLGTPRWNAITTRLAWDSTRSDRVKARGAALNAVSDDLNAEENV